MAHDKTTEEKLVASNRKARHEYFSEDTLEAGIALTGTEIKSVRQGRVSLTDACRDPDSEAYLVNAHISEYGWQQAESRPEKAAQIAAAQGADSEAAFKVKERGYTIVPLRMCLTRGYAKVEIGLARGKKIWDKREDIAKRDAQREIERSSKSSFRER